MGEIGIGMGEGRKTACSARTKVCIFSLSAGGQAFDKLAWSLK
jgi:hypothetical protein